MFGNGLAVRITSAAPSSDTLLQNRNYSPLFFGRHLTIEPNASPHASICAKWFSTSMDTGADVTCMKSPGKSKGRCPLGAIVRTFSADYQCDAFLTLERLRSLWFRRMCIAAHNWTIHNRIFTDS